MTGRVTRIISLTTRRVTMGDLRSLMQDAAGVRDDAPVSVRVAPSYPSPTDPGGEITISFTKTTP